MSKEQQTRYNLTQAIINLTKAIKANASDAIISRLKVQFNNASIAWKA